MGRLGRPTRRQSLDYGLSALSPGHRWSGTLNPFNGFIGVALRTALNSARPQHHRSLSFVVGGLTARLSLEVTGNISEACSVATCSRSRSTTSLHAQGHLQLVALECFLSFCLAFWMLVRPAFGSPGSLLRFALFLVILCDYYFIFCVLAGSIILGWLCLRRGSRPWTERSFRLGLGTFVVTSVAPCGPLLAGLLRLQARDPLIGAHDPNAFSLDLRPLIQAETGASRTGLAGTGSGYPATLRKQRVMGAGLPLVLHGSRPGLPGRRDVRGSRLVVPARFFALMALGQSWLLGQPLGHVSGPFGLLVWLVPPLKLAGAPVRMSVMTSLCVALISGLGFSILWRGSAWARGLGTLLVAVAVFGSWPRPQQLTPATFPPYVAEMRSLSKDYGLFDVDDAFGASRALYYQTVHEIPMAHGYISRVPASVAEGDAALDALAALGGRTLCERYGTTIVFSSGQAGRNPFGRGSSRRSTVGCGFTMGRLWNCAENPAAHPLGPSAAVAGFGGVGVKTREGVRHRFHQLSRSAPDNALSSCPVRVKSTSSAGPFARGAEPSVTPPATGTLRRHRLRGVSEATWSADVAEHRPEVEDDRVRIPSLGARHRRLSPHDYSDDQNGRTFCDCHVELGLR